MDEVFDKIIEKTFTIDDLHRRVALLKRILEAKLFSQDSPIATIEERDRTWLDSTLPVPKVSKDNITRIFQQLAEKVQDLKVLSIFVPVTLPNEEIDNIGKLIRKDYGAQILIEIRLDPLLIGGAALAWNGIYKDYSLRKKIAGHKDEIIASFQKYIR